MAQTHTFEVTDQKVRELQNLFLNKKLPEDSSFWKKLFSSSLADLIPAGVAILNENYNFIKCNRYYREYVSTYSQTRPENILGTNYIQAFPGVKDKIIDHIKASVDIKEQLILSEAPVPTNLPKGNFTSYWDGHVIPLKGDNLREGEILIFTTDATQRVRSEQRIQSYEIHIEEMKTTLRTVMALRLEDSRRMEQNLLANAKASILPFVNTIKAKRVNSDLRICMDAIEAGINALVSDFSNRLGSEKYNLTPKEIKVAALIKAGKTTKEIAECFHLATASIDFHRKNIRIKLGLQNEKINLQSFLTKNF